MTIINVHIEIPYDSAVKYEFYNKKLITDRIIMSSMKYPGNYGYIPNTMSDDGDPIDVLIINNIPLYPGSYVECKVLGMLSTEDEKGFDEKIIAVPCDSVDERFKNIHDIEDIDEKTLEIIKDFFTNYKNNENNKWIQCYDYKNKKEAIDFIESKTTNLYVYLNRWFHKIFQKN